MASAATRKSLLRARIMDFITSTATVPLLLGCVGVFSLCKLLQWLRTRADVRNAVVVITGATSGLGRECARVFHAAGAKLVLCGRNAEALEELTRELAASRATEVQTHKPSMVTFDLTDPGAIVGAAAEILQCFGYVDVLINNAGISYRGTIVDTSLDVDKRVMETNYFGPVALTKALLPSMIRRRQGHVVAISSIQGKISVPFRSAYAASKHATQAFFDCLRAEVEQHDIEVTVVSPGYIHTNLSLNAVTADGSNDGQDHGPGPKPLAGGPRRAGCRGEEKEGCGPGRCGAFPGCLPAHSGSQALLQPHGLPGQEGAETQALLVPVRAGGAAAPLLHRDRCVCVDCTGFLPHGGGGEGVMPLSQTPSLSCWRRTGFLRGEG
ncbi:dehydrogenase/reductase SDR family member 7B isoform X1 [Globicephala melas]|uniref:dehydrogenase/reductase SDR family member 7B isoform X1 n=1 Tax=Globicephala melas TaxID=9731 RepID=UPI00293D9405|nr:dehydrogenase/reductase SDR family member 7B isoform X1 [Globicephala melas]